MPPSDQTHLEPGASRVSTSSSRPSNSSQAVSNDSQAAEPTRTGSEGNADRRNMLADTRAKHASRRAEIENVREKARQENRGALPPAPDIRLSRRNWNREFGAWNLGVREVRSRFAERSKSAWVVAKVVVEKAVVEKAVLEKTNVARETKALLRELVACLPKLFTCADVNALFSSAKIEAAKGFNCSAKDDVELGTLKHGHLYEALSTSKAPVTAVRTAASVSPADERRYGEIFAPYCRPAKSGTPYAYGATELAAEDERTSGRWIVDQQGLRVKLACVNWAGAEVKDGVVGGLHLRSAYSIAKTFREMGFNCVRFPWSVWMVQRDPTLPMELQVDTLLKANPQLRGATALEILDASAQLLVILDNHVSDGTWCCSDVDENGLWHNSRWPTSDWLQAHLKLASRYARQPWVVGTELRNEASTAGNAVLTVNPHLLIIVERNLNGPEREWRGFSRLPVHLKTPEKLVYSAHSYSWSYPGLPDTYEALHAQLGKDWGFIVEDERPFTAPVWVSEFGTFSDCHKDGPGRSFWRFLTHVEEYIYI
ncbi:4-beta-glucanase E1) (Endocellulase E1) [Durusdinium trenchii]|uniref:4-beta-glucanase E1 (Endocellulase E1 n=1 Tax=Durusdinium trenchii TaxID=1381693 RepID=A0ABP0JXG6_9DINO